MTTVSKADKKQANELLMRFCASRNVAPTAVVCKEFADYISFISGARHTSVTRYHLMLALRDLCARIDSKKSTMLKDYSFVGFSADSWSKAGRHITAMTAGNPGTCFYLNSYENLGSDTAVASADAMHQCMLGSLGLPTDLSGQDSAYPVAKVSVFTSDTTNLMPATNRELCKFPMFEGCAWVACFPHVGNLFLLDQLKITSIANLLSHAKQVALTFRVGTFRKLFLTCVPSPMFYACDQQALLAGSSFHIYTHAPGTPPAP